MGLNLQHVLFYNPKVTMYGIVLHKKEAIRLDVIASFCFIPR